MTLYNRENNICADDKFEIETQKFEKLIRDNGFLIYISEQTHGKEKPKTIEKYPVYIILSFQSVHVDDVVKRRLRSAVNRIFKAAPPTINV